VERHPDYFDRMLFIMRQIDAEYLLALLAVALMEVLVQPLPGDNKLAQRYEAILGNSNHFRLELMTTTTARRAADLRRPIIHTIFGLSNEVTDDPCGLQTHSRLVDPHQAYLSQALARCVKDTDVLTSKY
jgi:hypothetical protein